MGSPIYKKPLADANRPELMITHQAVMRSQDYNRALKELNLHWENLPGALKELDRLETLFKDTNPSIYREAQATESQLQMLNKQGLLARHQYLVFSTHGYLNTEIPALSSIVLGQVANPPGIDGYVTAGEWPGYTLKSDLMVLSACNTGQGAVVEGEGVMGLPYSLYVAGNKDTMLTLWSISDEVTAEFISGFFANLRAGLTPVQALAAIKRKFISRREPYNHPMYWAAFVLYGV